MVVVCDIVIYMYVRDVCQCCDINMCMCDNMCIVSDICSWGIFVLSGEYRMCVGVSVVCVSISHVFVSICALVYVWFCVLI